MSRSDVPSDSPYTRIAQQIRQRIETGELAPGDRVPSTRQITREWGVAMATAGKVLAALRQEGLVRAVPGVGTVVAAGSAPPARRRERPGGGPEVTRERIVRVAIECADAEGLAALSMRRVAAEFGVATMTLYHYVPSKDELVLLMADAALGEERLPDTPPPGWRAQLELLARLQWAAYRRHPWLATVISMTRPQPLLKGMRHTEMALAALAGSGLPHDAVLHAAITVIGYVRGTAVSLEAEAEARRETGLTDQEWLERQDPYWERLMADGGFPELARFTQGEDVAMDTDSLFEFGLRRLLDGLAVFIGQQRAARRASG
ncbi:TetR/AcrR family transcriptional regulator C-terminal domain-containing protein [Streptomyces sp. NPDC092296]|uniref:TetR/AcrR family transcriptional regulator C-terminal domain-containing protein n=1 Tax=Streptomyces sp. NPDC092296 TaxID=3366012 RepID=UPI00380EB864